MWFSNQNLTSAINLLSNGEFENQKPSVYAPFRALTSTFCLFPLCLVVFACAIYCYLYFKFYYIQLYNQGCFSASTTISTFMVRWFDNQVTTVSIPLFRVSQMSEYPHHLTSYNRYIAIKTHSLIRCKGIKNL